MTRRLHDFPDPPRARARRIARDHPFCLRGSTDQDRQDRAIVHLAVVRVAVAPEHQLLEDEEQEDAAEQRREDMERRQLVERFRQDAEHRHAEQRADSIADEPGDELRAGGIADEKYAGSHQQPAQAAKQAQPERNEKRRHSAR